MVLGVPCRACSTLPWITENYAKSSSDIPSSRVKQLLWWCRLIASFYWLGRWGPERPPSRAPRRSHSKLGLEPRSLDSEVSGSFRADPVPASPLSGSEARLQTESCGDYFWIQCLLWGKKKSERKCSKVFSSRSHGFLFLSYTYMAGICTLRRLHTLTPLSVRTHATAVTSTGTGSTLKPSPWIDIFLVSVGLEKNQSKSFVLLKFR